MKTKFILHGGYSGHINEQNDSFFREILKNAPDKLNVLLVCFAKGIDKVPVAVKEDKDQFERNKGSRSISFQVADEKCFVEQVKSADIIYLHGGNTLKLLEALKKFPRLRELLAGKVVAGDSAGAYVLSSVFYSKTENGLCQGLGFVPVKIICHYVGENEDKLVDNQELKTLLLSDYQYKVFE
jgi:peptidase E